MVEEGQQAKKLARKGTLVNTNSEEESNDNVIVFNVSNALQKVWDLDATMEMPDNVRKAKKSLDVTTEHVKKCFRLEAEFLEALKNFGEYSITILFYFTYLFTCSHFVSITIQSMKVAKRNG